MMFKLLLQIFLATHVRDNTVKIPVPVLRPQQPVAARAEQPETLASITAKIAESPDDPALHAMKCRLLFAAGMEREAIEYAEVAMEKFIAADDRTAAIRMGTFRTDKHQVVVVYNMTFLERAKMGMTFPYSFHVWNYDDPPKKLKRIDWEINYRNNRPITAAVGEMVPNGHVNYGVLPVDSNYATVKAWVLRTLEKQTITAAMIRDENGEGRVEVYVDDLLAVAEDMEANLLPKKKTEEPAGEAAAAEAGW